MQWRGPRLDAMVQFCDENGLNPVTWEGQLSYLIYDLEYNYIYCYDLLRLSDEGETAAAENTFNIVLYYLAPSDPEEVSKERERLAVDLIYPLLCEWEENGK